MSHDRGMADDVKAWVLHVGVGGSWDDRIAFEGIADSKRLQEGL